MINSNPSPNEPGNGFDQIRARINAEHARNVEAAQESADLTTLACLQGLHEEALLQLATAEAELAMFYESYGRDIGELIATACQEEGLGDYELVAAAGEVTFVGQDGSTVGDITDENFRQQPQDSVHLFDQEECERLARNGLSYRIAEQLGIM